LGRVFGGYATGARAKPPGPHGYVTGSAADFIFGLEPQAVRCGTIGKDTNYQAAASSAWPQRGGGSNADLYMGNVGPHGQRANCNEGHTYSPLGSDLQEAGGICGGGLQRNWDETSLEVWRPAVLILRTKQVLEGAP
jgi:hypothetical protein